MSMSCHANFIKGGGGVQWFKQCSDYFIAIINLKNKHDKLFYFISNDWSFYVYLPKKYPKMTAMERMSLHEKIPTSDTLVDSRWSMHIGWVLKTQVVYVIIFCLYILYENYFDTPNNALNMLDNIWVFFL